MSEDTRIELRAPLPEGDATAVLTWRAARGGLRGDVDADRLTATHATLATTDLDGRRRERRLDLAQADAYLAQAREIHDRAAAITAGARSRKEEDRAERAALAATIRTVCPHCDVDRTYRGARNLMTLGRPEELQRVDQLGLARPGVVVHHEYACPRCGSIELFAAGHLDHPLS